MTALLTAHLWQSTFFAIAAALLTLAFRRNRAGVRYWLWLSASLKFLLPFALLTSLGNLLETRMPAAHHIATQLVSYYPMEQFTGPAVLENLPSRTPDPDLAHWIPLTIFGVWLSGFATIVLIRLRNWQRIRAAVTASTATNIPAAVDVRISSGLLEPGVVGFVRPILLLPAEIGQFLTPSQLEAVLAHELCHIRRRDNLFAALHMVVEAIFWFHPLVWWIGARLVEERERACDEEVLRLGNAADVYADAILNVCKLYTESPLACVSGVTGASIRQRIETILSNQRRQGLNLARKLLLATAGAATVTCPIVIGLIIGAGHAPPIHAQSPTPAPRVDPAISAAASAEASTQRIESQSQPGPTPRFDVASVRPCSPNDAPVGGGRNGAGEGGRVGFSVSPGRLSVTCMTVTELIGLAYVRYGNDPLLNDHKPFDGANIRGGAAWARSDRYTIEATTDDPIAHRLTEGREAPANRLLEGEMLRALLEDRFRLKIHREVELVPVYALTVAKGGLKLKPVERASCIEPDPRAPSRLPTPDEKPACHSILNGKNGLNSSDGAGTSNNWAFDYTGVSLSALAAQIGLNLDRPVIDKTGLTDLFSFHLEFARDENAPGPIAPSGAALFPQSAIESADIPVGSSIFSALEQQLGLKLEPAKGSHGFIVIDRVERPSEN